jgi:hypothetical protein
MLARVLSAAVNGIEAFPVEVEVNSAGAIRLSGCRCCGEGMAQGFVETKSTMPFSMNGPLPVPQI